MKPPSGFRQRELPAQKRERGGGGELLLTPHRAGASMIPGAALPKGEAALATLQGQLQVRLMEVQAERARVAKATASRAEDAEDLDMDADE